MGGEERERTKGKNWGGTMPRTNAAGEKGENLA